MWPLSYLGLHLSSVTLDRLLNRCESVLSPYPPPRPHQEGVMVFPVRASLSAVSEVVSAQ